MKNINDYQPAAGEIVYWMRNLPTVIEAAMGSMFSESKKNLEEATELHNAVTIGNLEHVLEEWADNLMTLAQMAKKLPPEVLSDAIMEMIEKNAERKYLA